MMSMKKQTIVICVLVFLILIGVVFFFIQDTVSPSSFYWDDPADTNPAYEDIMTI